MRRFWLTYLALLVAWPLIKTWPWVETALMKPFDGALLYLCAAIINAFGGAVRIVPELTLVGADNTALRMISGCNGLDAVFLVAAGQLAYPASWRGRCLGLAVGFVVIEAVNLLRFISLFYLSRLDRAWFDFAHVYVWDVLILLLGIGFFLFWIRRQTAPSSDVPLAT